ncbi:MAG: MBL fold metallo-hydrolase [Deferrisomatales bacterium]|nr:MBL fold metallo-hydrolase [Deferrisomatales bacterium]
MTVIHEPLEDLFLVDLDLPREGFRGFIGSWVLRRAGATVLVDPGPRATLPILRDALARLRVHRLDAVLLTHIHIDHAGGTGLLLDRYPEAQVVCHRKGMPHLADPAKLWAGSLQVLGDLAEAYGEIAPVPPERVTWEDSLTFGDLPVDALETPGHAAHHVSYRVGDLLFAGEAAGVRCALPEGPYLRPAAPPPFFYEEFRVSLLRLAATGAAHLCYGHGGHTAGARAVCEAALRQLDLWVRTVEELVRSGGEDLARAAFDRLLDVDPAFARFRDLPPDVQARERYFFGNTLQGLRGDAERRLAGG